MQKRMGAWSRAAGRSAGPWKGVPVVVLLLAVLFALWLAASAQASFHLMKVREVYPAGDASYVELQMFSAGEYLVAGHRLVVYNANGSVANEFSLPSNVSAGSPNNSTVLITDSGYAAAFPSGPTADELDANLNLSAAAGAVCWVDGSPPDCVSWGSFTGPFPSQVPALTAGSPASPLGVTAGKALRRSIAGGCSTLLESADDTDDSATDFSEQTPNPRANGGPVTEHTCMPPTATIDTKPKTPTNSTSASFTYHSTPAGAEFECKRDAEAFAICSTSGKEYMGLTEGSHTFQVRAKNSEGTGVAVFATWTVDTKLPTASIKSHPESPSSGASASFTYQSDEANSKFECSLAAGAALDNFAACPSTGKAYTSLADGTYTFKVLAIDQAGNAQATPAQFTWEVDNSLAPPPAEETNPPMAPPSPVAAAALEPLPETTKPNTLITAKPATHTSDRTPTFRFRASEPGATFQCKLDKSPYKSCRSPLTTKKLALGQHLLKVRALLGGVSDASPASFRFTITGAR